jgi:CheY-like chemotaxis protein
VELYRQKAEAIDLVLLDVKMPGMTGPQTLAALRQLNPDVRCCFTTGFTCEPLPAGLPVLRKPYSVGELASLLATALT